MAATKPLRRARAATRLIMGWLVSATLSTCSTWNLCIVTSHGSGLLVCRNWRQHDLGAIESREILAKYFQNVPEAGVIW